MPKFLVAPQGFEPRDGYRGTNIFGCPPGIRTPRRLPRYKHFWLPPRDSNPATVTAVQTFLVAPQGFEPRDGYRGTNIFGCPPGIRTPIERVRVASPTIEREG